MDDTDLCYENSMNEYRSISPETLVSFENISEEIEAFYDEKSYDNKINKLQLSIV